jgi:AcrR family transcriptional regulator
MDTRQRPSIKLSAGPHRLPREVVQAVQRGRLLDATAEVIAEEGYMEASVDKIIRRAKISRRTYYELFTDREDGFLAAYDEASEHVLGLIEDACKGAGTPSGKIERGLVALLEFCEKEPKVALMCVVEVMGAGARARKRRTENMARLTDMVADALAQELGSTDSTSRLRARMLVGGVSELVCDSLTAGRSEGLSKLAADIVQSSWPQEQAA